MVGRLGRVFVAAPLPDEVRIALADRLRGIELPGKVAPPENWHMTLRFLGTLDEVTYERFLGLLDASDLGHSFRVGLGGLGAFPRPRSATVVWVDVDQGGDRLLELSAVCEEAAQGAGLAPEDRPFRPHLTLSRLRPGQDVTDLVSGWGGFDIRWRCDSVVVYRSHLGRGGARYEPLETLPLIR